MLPKKVINELNRYLLEIECNNNTSIPINNDNTSIIRCLLIFLECFILLFSSNSFLKKTQTIYFFLGFLPFVKCHEPNYFVTAIIIFASYNRFSRKIINGTRRIVIYVRHARRSLYIRLIFFYNICVELALTA